MKLEQITGSVYDHPGLYDVLFSADYRQEIAFLQRYLDRQGSVFEPACGTGRLLWRLGKLGHEVVGLDLNPKAVTYCNRRLRRHGLPETAVVGDMTNFSLADFERHRGRNRKKPFDLAFNFVSSFLHLTTEAAALAHLAAVADSLKPGGRYLLGLHFLPRGLPRGEAHCSSESWSVRHGSLSLRSRLGRIAVDHRKRIETVEFRIKAVTPKRRYEVLDTFPLRTYSARQFYELLNKSSRFEIDETFDFSLDQPIRVDTQTEDVVFVLRAVGG